MKRAITEYAKKILADHDCGPTSYWGATGEEVIRDLKEAYPNGMAYPYVDVANAILLLAKPHKLIREPWMMVWDNEHSTDGVCSATFEAAKEDALDTLAAWAAQAMSEWAREKPNTDEKHDWDYMINNCSVCVKKYNPDTDEYEDYWEPSQEDEQMVGWMEWKELRKMERS